MSEAITPTGFVFADGGYVDLEDGQTIVAVNAEGWVKTDRGNYYKILAEGDTVVLKRVSK